MIIKSLNIFEKDPEVIVETINKLINKIDDLEQNIFDIEGDMEDMDYTSELIKKEVDKLKNDFIQHSNNKQVQG